MLLSVNGLSAGYGHRPALHELSLEVDTGEIVSILGANGAGKSTTLRALSGLIGRTQGSIQFDGKRVDRLAPDMRAKLGLGHVPEGRGILGKLTVGENLRLGLAAQRSGLTWTQRLDEVIELFPALSGRLTEAAGNLSGGQQQMLAIGRALIAKPKLLMIDEMSFGLAPNITAQILDAVQRLRNEGQTFLLVEQDASVLKVSDRTYVLAGGRVQLHERSSDLLHTGRDRLAHVYLGGSISNSS